MTTPESYLATQPQHYIAYSPRGAGLECAVVYFVRGDDVYGWWTGFCDYRYPQRDPQLPDPIAVEDELCHQLEQLQDSFANEWLWFSGQPGSESEAAAYARDELAVEDVNLRHRHLGKLRKDAPVWTHASHDLSPEVIDCLAERWPLGYRRA